MAWNETRARRESWLPTSKKTLPPKVPDAERKLRRSGAAVAAVAAAILDSREREEGWLTCMRMHVAESFENGVDSVSEWKKRGSTKRTLLLFLVLRVG